MATAGRGELVALIGAALLAAGIARSVQLRRYLVRMGAVRALSSLVGLLAALALLVQAVNIASSMTGGGGEYLRYPALWIVAPAVALPLAAAKLGPPGFAGGLLLGWTAAIGAELTIFMDLVTYVDASVPTGGFVVFAVTVPVLLATGAVLPRTAVDREVTA